MGLVCDVGASTIAVAAAATFPRGGRGRVTATDAAGGPSASAHAAGGPRAAPHAAPWASMYTCNVPVYIGPRFVSPVAPHATAGQWNAAVAPHATARQWNAAVAPLATAAPPTVPPRVVGKLVIRQRCKAGSPLEVHLTKQRRVEDNVRLYYTNPVSLALLDRLNRHSQQAASTWICSAMGYPKGTTPIELRIYAKATALRVKTLKLPWMRLRHTRMFAGLAVGDDGGHLIATLARAVDRVPVVGPPNQQWFVLGIDGWHPKTWTRCANGRQFIRSRSLIALSLAVPPSQFHWSRGIVAVSLAESESVRTFFALMLESAILTALERNPRSKGKFFLNTDNGLNRKALPLPTCYRCGATAAECAKLTGRCGSRSARSDPEVMAAVTQQFLPAALPAERVTVEYLHTLALWLVPFLTWHGRRCPLFKRLITVHVKVPLTWKHGGDADDGAGRATPTSASIHDMTRITSPPVSAAVAELLPEESKAAWNILIALRHGIDEMTEAELRRKTVLLHEFFFSLETSPRAGLNPSDTPRVTKGMHQLLHIAEDITTYGSLWYLVGQSLEGINQRLNVSLQMTGGNLFEAIAHENAIVGATASGLMPATVNDKRFKPLGEYYTTGMPPDPPEDIRRVVNLLKVGDRTGRYVDEDASVVPTYDNDEPEQRLTITRADRDRCECLLHIRLGGAAAIAAPFDDDHGNDDPSEDDHAPDVISAAVVRPIIVR
jgi:hypothetical protein